MIIKKLSAKNKTCFGYEDVIAEFSDKDPSHLPKVLVSMVSMGMLMRLYRDLYCIIPLSADPETYSPESCIVAKRIMKGKGYYIAYSSAMHIHELTDQPEARTMVVTDRQRQPSKQTIKGTEFHFIYHSYRRFSGYEELWISMQEQAFHC